MDLLKKSFALSFVILGFPDVSLAINDNVIIIVPSL